MNNPNRAAALNALGRTTDAISAAVRKVAQSPRKRTPSPWPMLLDPFKTYISKGTYLETRRSSFNAHQEDKSMRHTFVAQFTALKKDMNPDKRAAQLHCLQIAGRYKSSAGFALPPFCSMFLIN